MLLRGAPAETPHSLLDCPPRREQDRLDPEGTGGRIRCELPSVGGRSRDGAGEWQGGCPPGSPRIPSIRRGPALMIPMLLRLQRGCGVRGWGVMAWEWGAGKGARERRALMSTTRPSLSRNRRSPQELPSLQEQIT